MASAPFTGDTGNPTDNYVVSSYPANERTNRDVVFSYINTDHDSTTGHHKGPVQFLGVNAGAPSAPASGFVIYIDSSDSNKLKIKGAGGTVTTLAVS